MLKFVIRLSVQGRVCKIVGYKKKIKAEDKAFTGALQTTFRRKRKNPQKLYPAIRKVSTAAEKKL
jgi:hypothetical protein